MQRRWFAQTMARRISDTVPWAVTKIQTLSTCREQQGGKGKRKAWGLFAPTPPNQDVGWSQCTTVRLAPHLTHCSGPWTLSVWHIAHQTRPGQLHKSIRVSLSHVVEIGLALFNESSHAFTAILCFKAGIEHASLVFQPLLQRGFLRRIDAFPRDQQRR